MSHSPEPFGQPVDSHVLLKQLCAKLNELDTKHNQLADSFRAAGKARKPRKGKKERRRLLKKKAEECRNSDFHFVGMSDVADFEEVDNSESNSAKSSVSAVPCGVPCGLLFDASSNGLDSQPAMTWNPPTPWIFKDEVVDLQARIKSAEERAEVAEEVVKWKFKDELEALRKCAKAAEERAEVAEGAEKEVTWKFKNALEALNQRAKDAEGRAKVAEKRAEVAEELSKWKFKDELEALRKRAVVAEELAEAANKRAEVAEEELGRWKLKLDLEALRMGVAVAEERAKVAEEKIKMVERQAWFQSHESSTFAAPLLGEGNTLMNSPEIVGPKQFNAAKLTIGSSDQDMAVEPLSEVNPFSHPLYLGFGGPPGLTSSKAQFCQFWKCGQCTCGAGCQFSQDPDLLNTIQKPQTWTAPEFEMSSGESLRPLVYSVALHPVSAMAFVKFYSFDLCVSFASSPPEIISLMQVTVKRSDKDASTVVIRFSGHHEDLDAKAIAEEVDVNLRAHSRIAFLHLISEHPQKSAQT